MLLKMDDWQRIREDFSEQEKFLLNAAITGETICPKGCVLDEQKLGDLLYKVRRLVLLKP